MGKVVCVLCLREIGEDVDGEWSSSLLDNGGMAMTASRMSMNVSKPSLDVHGEEVMLIL